MQKTIFIAEDNLTNLKLIKDILQAKNYKTLETYDGKSALLKIKKEALDIDLILTDIQMPKLSGIDLIKQLRQDVKTQDIPVIVVSAQAMDCDIKKAKKAGAIDYITKPINIVQFLQKVETHIK